MMQQELEISHLEHRKYSEKCQLQVNHIDTLEKLLEK
jgi:hypothetical protein